MGLHRAAVVELDAEVLEHPLLVPAQSAEPQRARVRAAEDVAQHRHAGIAQLVDRTKIEDHLASGFLHQLALQEDGRGRVEPPGDPEKNLPFAVLALHGPEPRAPALRTQETTG